MSRHSVHTTLWMVFALLAIAAGACTPQNASPTPSATRLPESQEYASPTPPPVVATPTESDREARVRDLLTNNAGCRLPCFWGVLPGVSSADEADSLFLSMGARVLVTSEGPAHRIHEVGGLDLTGGSLQTELSFLESDGVVQSIMVHGLGQNYSEHFREVWGNYSPQHAIAQLGTPTRIWLESARTGSPHEGYALWLFYDDRGVLLQYSGLAESGSVLRICPTFSEPSTISSLRIIVQGPATGDRLEDLLPYSVDPNYVRDFQAATGLSLEEAAAILANEVPPCFDTPTDIWPL